MKRSVLFLVGFVPFLLTACGGGGGGNAGGALPSTPSSGNVPISNGSSNGSSASSNVLIHEKHITSDTLRGGLALGTDGNLYASGQVGLQVIDQSLDIIPGAATTATPPDTWPVVPHLAPSGAVTASGKNIGALATSTTGTSAAATTAPPATPTFPALAVFDTTAKQWTDVQFGNQGDVYVDLAPDDNAGFFVAGNHPNGQGFVQEINPVFCFLLTQTFAQPLAAITIGKDGLPWVATAAGKNVPSILFHLGVTGIAKTVPLPSPSEVTSLVEGPDGNLWFTDAGRDSIGRLDSTGNVTLFAAPGGKGLQLDGITVASDGTLWFTETHGHKLGRITTSGVISDFTISPTADPHEAVGCDNVSNGSNGLQLNTNCASRAVFYVETKAYGKATF